MYFNNGLLQPAKHLLVLALIMLKNLDCFFGFGGAGIKPKPKPKQNMLKTVIWVWQKHPVFVYLRSHLPILPLAGEFSSLPEE